MSEGGSGGASVSALRARLRAVGVAEERLDAAARELAARLDALASVPDERLEGVAPATVFAAAGVFPAAPVFAPAEPS